MISNKFAYSSKITDTFFTKKYLFIVLLVGVCFGQDSSSIEKNDKKVRCRECFLPMRETISAYICRDNHMRIEKTDLKVDQESFVNKGRITFEVDNYSKTNIYVFN